MLAEQKRLAKERAREQRQLVSFFFYHLFIYFFTNLFTERAYNYDKYSCLACFHNWLCNDHIACLGDMVTTSATKPECKETCVQ